MRTRETLPEEKVKCTMCGASPWVRCTTDSGVGRRPHADRVARYNGLLPTPRAGCYAQPSPPIQYDADETPSPIASVTIRDLREVAPGVVFVSANARWDSDRDEDEAAILGYSTRAEARQAREASATVANPESITDEQIKLIKEYAIATEQTYLIKVARKALDQPRSRIKATHAACRKLCAQHWTAAKAWHDRVDNADGQPDGPDRR